jgi:hypothetical protein
MTSTDNDLHLFLGRVEGKLDAVITAQAGFTASLERERDARQSLADRVAAVEVRRTTLKEWWALAISVLTACTVIYSNLKGLIH